MPFCLSKPMGENLSFSTTNIATYLSNNTMEKVYRSKVDFWLLVFIYAVIIASVVPIGYSGDLIASVIIASVLIVPITFYLFNIKYVISGSRLIVKDGLFSHAYDISDIQSIRPTHTLLSAPAASFDRLEINFTHDTLVVSPKHKDDFISQLSEVAKREIKPL